MFAHLIKKYNIFFVFFGNHPPHIRIHPHANPDKKLDVQRLNRAIRLTMTAKPLYGARYVNQWWEPRWEEWEAEHLDNYTFVELEETTGDVEKAYFNFFLEQMDPANQPFIKFKIFRQGTTDTVGLNFNCVAADGYGTGAIIFTIFHIYNKLAKDPDFMPKPSNTDLRTSRNIVDHLSKWELFKLPFLGALNHFSNRKTLWNWEFPYKEYPEMKKTIVYHRFRPGFLDILNRYRKAMDATINDVMLASYYKALFDIIQPDGAKPYCVLNTYDLPGICPRKKHPAWPICPVTSTQTSISPRI